MNQDESLVTVRTSNRLIVEPIWEKPIDELEGPLYQQYIGKNPDYRDIYVREKVAGMLHCASNLLPDKYTLIIRAGHRPLEVQRQLLQRLMDEYKDKNTDASNKEALDFARTYVSDPAVKLPPHCCGAAIDVDCLDTMTGELVDFGCSVNTDDPISFTDSPLISSTQRANRKVLHKAMLEAGFAPFAAEWWHFSYGDAEWAAYYHKTDTIPYGIVDL